MSAFVVEDSTISRVASLLYLDRDSEREKRDIAKTIEADYQSPTFAAELAREMALLNREAVNQRYEEGEIAELPQFRIETCGKIAALKSLRCWLYQCSEGDVPERPFFKAMDALANSWALDIVREMPEWEAVEWA